MKRAGGALSSTQGCKASKAGRIGKSGTGRSAQLYANTGAYTSARFVIPEKLDLSLFCEGVGRKVHPTYLSNEASGGA